VFLSGFGAVVYCFFYTLQVRPTCRARCAPRRAPHCALRLTRRRCVRQGVYADIPTVSEAVYIQVR
jgi:hypothetical protein